MNLKDLIHKDNEKVFMNTKELAEIHDFNGKKIKCIVTDFTSKDSPYRKNAHYEGLIGKNIRIYINKKDLTEIPANNVEITFDDKPYLVKSSFDSMGMVIIAIEGVEFCL